MFGQVLQGRVRDADQIRKQLDVWDRDLKPGAQGYMGATGGVTDDGQFIAVVRFESADAAQANSNRPEQGEWWQETSSAFEGDVTFHDCDQVDLFLGGGSDDAGFVQVMQGRADRQQLQSQASELETALRQMRPDVIGGLIAWHNDEPGRFTQVIYFNSEAEAREGEQQELSEEQRQERDRMLSSLQDLTYIDLRQPIIRSA